MVKPCIYRNADDIRRLLTEHGDELVKEKQEIRIAWKGAMSFPAVCLLRGWEPPGDGEYSDTLGVYAGGEVVYIISPSQITHFEVLPTKKITGDTFMSDMRQMEHAGGLDTPK
jgi:hypothetical protein